MIPVRKTAMAACLMILAAGPVLAQQVIDSYTAEIGPEDRINSRGAALKRPEQILAQDRANFHRFNIRHPGDTADTVFSDRSNRANLADMLRRGSLGRDLADAIVHGRNPRIRVDVVGRGGRPHALNVTVFTPPPAPVPAPALPQVAAPPAPTGSLPVFGGTPQQWSFTAGPQGWRGTASVQAPAGRAVAFGCTRPGGDPAAYPGGGHVRPHEPGVYNLLIAPDVIGGTYGQPGAGTFQLEIAIDGQPRGAAPVILIAPEMMLGTNMPMAHPFLDELRNGRMLTLTVRETGGQVTVPLAGFTTALQSLAAFCAEPIAPALPQVAAPPAPVQPAPRQPSIAQPAPAPRQPAIAQPAPSPRQPAIAPAPAPAPAAPAAQSGSAVTELKCTVGKENPRGTGIRCTEPDGSALETTKYHVARAQFGLRALGCEVPVITGRIADSPEGVACFLEMFRLKDTVLSNRQILELAGVSEVTDTEQAIAKFVRRGYTPPPAAGEPPVGTFPLDTAVIAPVPLSLPDTVNPEYYQLSGYVRTDMLAPLTRAEILDFAAPMPRSTLRNLRGKVISWVSTSARNVTPLFDEEQQTRRFGAVEGVFLDWIQEMACVRGGSYCEEAYEGSDLMPDRIISAIEQSPQIHVCHYDRRRAPGSILNPRLSGVPGLVIQLGFWAQPIPVVLSAAELNNFDGSSTGMHPLVAIGPVQEECPPTLGAALELIVGHFPERVPAASPPEAPIQAALADPGPGDGPVPSLDDPRQAQVRELLGLSLAETTVNAFGTEQDRRFLIVDMVAEDGPAFRAGFRSGDYLWAIGWAEAGDVATFVRELDYRQDNGAVVMTRAIPGERPENATLLIPFAQDTPEAFRKIDRTPETEVVEAGWTLIAENRYDMQVGVRGDPWCGNVVQAEYREPLNANQTVATSSNVYREGLDAITAQCPEMRQLDMTFVSNRLNARISVRRYTFGPDGTVTDSHMLGLDGLPPAQTVAQARKLAAAQAPLCDRLASHPSDRNRRYGLEGNEFMIPDTLEQAIEACIAAVEANPEDPVTNFQLGRALFEATLYEDALPFLEVAAAADHGGALDYLGQMYFGGLGVEADPELGDTYFDGALAAGFDPFRSAADEGLALDTTGVTVPHFIEDLYGMSIRLMPQYANRRDINVGSDYSRDTLRYFFHVAKEIGEACGDQATLDRFYDELDSPSADTDSIEHAIFLYESYLPNLLPVMAERVGEDMSSFQEGGSTTGFALTSRYDCGTVQIRQIAMNAADLIMR